MIDEERYEGEYPEDRFLRGIQNGLLIMAAVGIIYLLTRNLF